MILNPNSDNGNMKRKNGNIKKQVENFKYLGSNIESTEKDIEIRISKAWSALNSMRTIWKSKMNDSLKRRLLRAKVEYVLFHGAITWTLRPCRSVLIVKYHKNKK